MEEAKMRTNLRRKSILAAVALTVLAAPITSTAREDRDDVTTYRARLTGFGEVPPKLASGQGKFTGALSADGASISWTLTWSDLTTPAQAGPRARTDPGIAARSPERGPRSTSCPCPRRTSRRATSPAS